MKLKHYLLTVMVHNIYKKVFVSESHHRRGRVLATSQKTQIWKTNKVNHSKWSPELKEIVQFSPSWTAYIELLLACNCRFCDYAEKIRKKLDPTLINAGVEN